MTSAVYWSLRDWTALDGEAVYALLRLRAEVFVVEQNCAFLDPDGHDRHAAHLFGVDDDGALLAYARLLPPGIVHAECSIGRIVTASAVRRSGLGRELMAQALSHCRARHPGPIRIGAQQRLQAFYESFGFRPCDTPYLEDGILHVAMRLTE
jgi:Predicted acyltransferase